MCFQYITCPTKLFILVSLHCCNGNPPRVGARQYPCPFEACQSSVSSEELLQRHIRYAHRCEPQKCICGAGPFATKPALEYHRRSHRLEIDEMRCPHANDGCNTPDKVYTQQSYLEMHLCRVHSLTKLQVNELMPERPKANRRSCPVNSACVFPGNSWVALRFHLILKHGKTMQEALEMAPLQYSERNSRLICHIDGCYFFARRPSGVQKHLAEAHGVTTEQEDEEPPGCIETSR